MPDEGKNILFTSLWDNYPDSASIALNGKASHIYLVVAGSTNHMQCNIENGIIRVDYADGSTERVSLINPHYAPIEQDFYYDNHAFALAEGSLPPYRLHLKDGHVSRHLGKELDIKGVDGRRIEAGASVLVDIPVNPERELKSLTLETLSGDVVIGLMGLTIQRP